MLLSKRGKLILRINKGEPMEIKKVSVVGSGTMGTQIAMQTAIFGYEVRCYSSDPESLKNAEEFSRTWFSKSVLRGKMSEEEAKSAQSRLTFMSDDKEAMKDADLVIEAVSDVVSVKREVLAQVDALTPDHTIFASNSSYIVSSRFADAVKNPEKVINMHFFNPALVMKLVEVVQGSHCSQDTVDTMVKFVKSIGKEPALVKKEIYGFVVNRIFSAITKEACSLLDQDVASIEDIDKAVKLGLSHPMGPFELLDLTGIDLEYDILTERYQETGALADKPSAALVERYSKGHYGRKTKKGFYEYE